jgi:hypothetical protein
MDVNGVVAVNGGASDATSVQSTSVTRDASARAAEEGRDRPAEHTDKPPEEER